MDKSVIRQPLITEKATRLSSNGEYVFAIKKEATKSEAKKAIESIYGVKIVNINVLNVKGKQKRLGRSLGRTSSLKKVVIRLQKGQKIDVMPA